MPPSLQTAPIVALNPLDIPEWDSLVAGHSGSCFFHTAEWAQVLRESYGHQPVYFGSRVDGALDALLPVMEVHSPVTGRRGVALPFSDFCPTLNGHHSFEKELVAAALEHGDKRSWRYLEFRGARPKMEDAVPSMQYYGHAISLEETEETLFSRCDDAVRRGVRKGEKSGLQMKFGSTLASLEDFYALHCRTRRRHGLPPQPFRFFRSIGERILQTGQGFVATALSGLRPVASAVFFHDRRKAIYKFGASDFAFQQMRPNNFLMWQSIRHCLRLGLTELHLGRTSLLNQGLRRFKLGFGAREGRIDYFKFDFARQAFVGDIDRAESWVNGFFRSLPLPLLRLSGQVLYPHLS